MKVSELIEILKTIDNQDAKVMVHDSSAGHREIEYVEDALDRGVTYIIQPAPTKRRGKR